MTNNNQVYLLFYSNRDLCITEINAKIEKKRIIMEFLSTTLFPRLRMKA